VKRETLLRELLGLNEKIEELRQQLPRLSGQLQLLADFIVHARADRHAAVRNEALFALIYCAKVCDLIPDSIPEIGYSDDAAVVELVLARNAPIFEAHSKGRGIDWQTPASDIITPLERISCLSIEDACETLWQKVVLTGHSHYPVARPTAITSSALFC